MRTATPAGSGQAVTPPARYLSWPGPTLAALVLVVVGEQVVTGGPLTRLDRRVETALVPHRANLTVDLARRLTWLGRPQLVVPLLLVVVLVVAWRSRRRLDLIRTVSLLVGLGVSVVLLKYAVDRPAAHGSRAYGGTWPSGHTATATVVWGALARLLPLRRAADLAVRAGVPLLVGLSVVLAGQHQVSDVLGAWALGTLLLAAADRPGRWRGGLRQQPIRR